MKKIVYLLLLLSCAVGGFAQGTYTISSIPYNPDPFASGTNTGIQYDDIWGTVVTLPFPFCFYDSSYNHIVIGSNGIVTFDLSVANGYCSWPITVAAPDASFQNRSIMAPHQDIDPGMGGTIKYDVQGTAPWRRFIVSYYQVPMFSCNNIFFSQQLILYETSNLIEVHILDKPICPTWNGGAAIEGVQRDAGTGVMISGRNFPTQWTATGDAYRFLPTGTCAGPLPSDSVKGKVYADYNNNCVQDPGDFPRANRAVLANGGQFYDWTDANGQYGIGMVPGNYSIAEMVTSPFYASNCVPGGVYNLTVGGTVINNIDFADSAGVVCSDLSVGIGSPGLRRCRTSPIFVTYCNDGTYPDTGVVVTVVLNDSISIDSSTVPYTSLGGNTYSFSVGSLGLGQCGIIGLYCDIGCDTAGTVYCVSASIAGTFVECDTMNNTDNDCQALLAPLDPNIKQVAAQDFANLGYVTEDEIDDNDELTYMVHFQNVGTVPAMDVVIRDTIDSHLSPESIVMGAASALYNYAVNGNELVVRFNNINLPDSTSDEPGSHGFVKFSIRQRPGNPLGTVINNQAAIYFDFEAPVITNQTINTIPLASAVNPGLQNVASIYPNPGREQLIVQRTVDMNMEFVLMDLAGKELRRVAIHELRTAVPTGDLPSGLYLYRLETPGQLLDAGKWVKQ